MVQSLSVQSPEDGLSVISTCDHCGAQVIHPNGCDGTCVDTPLIRPPSAYLHNDKMSRT